MRTIKTVEMADDNNVFEIVFGQELTVKPDGEGFSTYEGEEEINYFRTEAEANKANMESIIDDDLIIKGYGRHSGRKFWQLPETIKDEILSEAKK